jgi:general secretion pathway protein B
MSYILDALKKAEKERQKGVSPGLLTGNDVISQKQSRRTLWPYLLTVVLLLNAGLFVWLLGPWGAKRPAASPLQAERNRAASSAAKVTEPADISPVESLPAPRPLSGGNESSVKKQDATSNDARASAPPKADLPLRNASVPPHPDSAGSDRTIPEERKEKAAPPRSSAREVPSEEHTTSDQKRPGKTDSPVTGKVYKMNELPQSVLEGLPQLSLSLHLYNTDPSLRLISVKGKTLREGQELAAGLRLEEITPQGAVFSFQNFRFQVGLNSK